MKKILRLFLTLLGFTATAEAQTYTMDWASSVAPSWSTGSISGNAPNIGGSGVSCLVTMSKSGGVYTTTLGPLGGPATPTVSSATYIVAGSASNLQIALDYATNTDYTDVVFTFSQPVYNVSFNIADIDRLTSTSYNYLDRVTITGYMGAVSGAPSITKYDPVTDPNFLVVSGGMVYVNAVNGMAGNTASDASDQKGTIKVNFGHVFISSFKLRYDNYTGTIADPTVQNISIGDISFSKTIPLPVRVLSFDGRVNNNNKVDLNWQTADEEGLTYYGVERSEDGFSFQQVKQLPAKNIREGSSYQFTDRSTESSSYYYRIKLVNQDGSFVYSKTIHVLVAGAFSLKVYPTIANSSVTVQYSLSVPENVAIILTNVAGQQLVQLYHNSNTGINRFEVPLPSSLGAGNYFVSIPGRSARALLIKQ